jgi:hypothetical protein
VADMSDALHLSVEDRALLMQCPLRETIPQAMKGVSAKMLRQLAQVVALRRRGFIAVKLDMEASNAKTVVRTIELTTAGLAALHGAPTPSQSAGR